MARWVTTPQPKAQLEEEPGNPHKDSDGREWYFFHTVNGVRFARIVEPAGLVIWRKEIL